MENLIVNFRFLCSKIFSFRISYMYTMHYDHVQHVTLFHLRLVSPNMPSSNFMCIIYLFINYFYVIALCPSFDFIFSTFMNMDGVNHSSIGNLPEPTHLKKNDSLSLTHQQLLVDPHLTDNDLKSKRVNVAYVQALTNVLDIGSIAGTIVEYISGFRIWFGWMTFSELELDGCYHKEMLSLPL